MSGGSTLVVGVGNPFRHDDGVGVVVVERLREMAVPGVDVVEETGEPAALVQRWVGYRTVVIVDAVDSGAPPGSVHHFELNDGEWDAAPPSSVLSTHGTGVAHAVELARVLDRLPDRLVFLGVETGDVTDGVGLTPAVAAGAEGLLAELMASLAAPVQLRAR